jgi:hypothetical protein
MFVKISAAKVLGNENWCDLERAGSDKENVTNPQLFLIIRLEITSILE